jgi:lysophospholipase L1-like esterase
MVKHNDAEKKYSESDLEKIRKRASEIWRKKHESLNTALDDWLQAEREFRAAAGIKHPTSAFDDWIEAEKEFKEELKKRKISVRDLFDCWFGRLSSRVDELLKKDDAVHSGMLNDMMEQQYVELMAECMT